MNLFDLVAKIILDTDDFDNGLDRARGAAEKFGGALKSGLATAAKVGAAAVTVATAAVTAFAKSSIDVGMEFDKSMSQVAATMGKSMDELNSEVATVELSTGTFTGTLREFAQEMGAKTAFSATEAASALNYMALAGYNTEQSMQALPNVLNLAAAGGIDLASAADMVTDAQSALGLSMDESAELVDKMAMASSKSNTSVAQLGDAILTVGGTAKNLAGGTTEMATALGILADNGIKGAEGGTALRNIILSLGAPTDKAAEALEAMGVKVYDAAGNMRPLNETFSDLDAALSTMTQGEQTQVLNTIFNKVDLKSVNALLDNTGERFDELSGYIDNATGSAQKMADTQLDNLAGDITLFKSALEGAKIVISDQLTPSLREFVQFGSNSITKITDAFKEGGLSGAVEAAGEVLSELTTMIITGAPKMIAAGIKLLSALGEGLLENLPELAESALEIILMLAEAFIDALPEIVKAGVEIISTLALGIAEALPELIPAAVDAILQIVESLTDPDTLGMLVDAAIQIMIALAIGLVQALPNLIEAIPEIIKNLIQAFVENAPKLAVAALELIMVLGEGLIAAIPQLLAYIVEIPAAIIGGIKDGLAGLADIGPQIIEGLVDGIKKMGKWLEDQISGFFGGIVDGVKDLLGIHSPSRVFAGIGENMALGLGAGWDNEFSSLKNRIENDMNFGTASIDFEQSGLAASNRSVVSGLLSGMQEFSFTGDIVINFTSEIEGEILARKLFRYNRAENSINGYSLVEGASM